MPAELARGQPIAAANWFGTAAGQALIASESDAVQQALLEAAGHPWLWLSPIPQLRMDDAGRGLQLWRDGSRWTGDVHCELPYPLARESIGTIVWQHAPGAREFAMPLLEECMRVLMPGGRLWMFALNPLSPYRRYWIRSEVRAAEPVTWRRRLRASGLQPESVSQGIGPRWSIAIDERMQEGAGIRAAYLLRAEKRAVPMSPMRAASPLRAATSA